jgi:hypothetical protein
VYAAATAVGAYVGSVVLQNVVGMAVGGRGDVGNIDMPGPG